MNNPNAKQMSNEDLKLWVESMSKNLSWRRCERATFRHTIAQARPSKDLRRDQMHLAALQASMAASQAWVDLSEYCLTKLEK